MNAYIFAGLKNGTNLLEQTPAARYKWYNRGCAHSKLTKDDYGKIMELFIASDMPIKDIAKLYKVDQTTISRIITMYFQKPDRELTLASRV